MTITKHGRPAAVVISIDGLASLEETLDIMGRPKLLSDVRDGIADLASKDAQVLSKRQILASLAR